MKKAVFSILLASGIGLPLPSFADTTTLAPAADTFPVVNWVSKNANDPVTINNGTAAPLSIMISVNPGDKNALGIDIKNCGDTNHIDAGSSAMCLTNDADNPVSFSSTSQTYPASGSYQLQKPSG